MEGQNNKGQSPHQYHHEQWSRLVRRNTLATSTTSVPGPALLYAPQVSTTIEAFPDLLPQQTVAYQAQVNAYNKLVASGARSGRVQSSPLPPLLSTQHIQAVPRSGTSGYDRQKKPTGVKFGHGNKKTVNTGTGDRSLIAADQNNSDMATPQAEPQGNASRTQQQHSAHTHQSSSVPSTPHQRARNASAASREPSPIPATNHSPRSAYSESNTAFPVYRPLASRLGRCPYETGMAHSRRRMPYKLGSDKLEKAKPGTVKVALSDSENLRLTQDMKLLYEKLLPSTESEARRRKFVQKLENLLNTEWPGHDIRVHVFGSSGNMLCTDDSDVDICITTEWKELERVCMLADLLARHGMTHINCVSTAKVPIVKVWDPELKLACDMNVNNTLALDNTRMIKTYVEIDWRVRPLAMIVKHWTKRRIVNDAAFGGTLSSYTWICMIINFLQLREPPILPSLHEWQEKKGNAHGHESAFADNLEELKDFGKSNNESLGELLFAFFRFYAHEIDYEESVVSVRSGKLLTKSDKGWTTAFNNCLCVEEPFNTTRNLGNTADDFSFRGLHLELRRAFDLIAEVHLDECCKQYEFPKEEERTLWERPTPAPSRPLIISRSASQTRLGRGGGHGGGNSSRGRHNHHTRNSGSTRRASSVTYEPTTAYVNPTMPPVNQNEAWLHHQHAQAQLHEMYMTLQAQKDSLLQLHMYNQEHQSQSRPELHRHGSVGAQHVGDRSRGMSIDPGRGMPYNNGPLTAPIYWFYPIPLPDAQMYQPQSNSVPYPSSPSMPSMQSGMPELRRSLHRPSVTSANALSSSMQHSGLRSHSQPAIRSGQSPYPFTQVLHGMAGMPQQMNGVMAQNPATDGHSDSSFEADSRGQQAETHSHVDVEKDYKGYVLNGSSFYQKAFDDNTYLAPESPGRRRVSTEQYSRDQGASRSRSPSPGGRGDGFSFMARSAPVLTGVSNSVLNGSSMHIEHAAPAKNGTYAIPARRRSAAPFSLSTSSSCNQLRDSLTDSLTDSLADSLASVSISNQTMSNGSVRGHAETRGLGMSIDFGSTTESGRDTPSDKTPSTTSVHSIAEEVVEATVEPEIKPLPLLEPAPVSPRTVPAKPTVNEKRSTEPPSPKVSTPSTKAKKNDAAVGALKFQRCEAQKMASSALSPVYEAKNPIPKGRPVSDTQSNGRSSGGSHDGSHLSKRNSEKRSQKPQPSSPVKGHTRNAKSEGSGQPNWSQVGRHRRRNGGNDKPKAAAPTRSEEAPPRDSERKGG